MGIRARFLPVLLALWAGPLAAQTRVVSPVAAPTVGVPAVATAPRLAAPVLAPLVPSFQITLKPALAPTVSVAPKPAVALAAAVAPKQGEEAPRPETFTQVFDGQAAAPLRLVIAGPPGAGKSTAAKRLAEELGVVHIGAGDLLREHAKTDPAAAAAMQKGELVDSALILRLVRERLQRDDAAKRGFILDGFPRRVEEAEAIKDIPLDAVIHLNVPEEELRRRLAARGRADDTEEALRNRLRIYREETLPVIERLAERIPLIAPKTEGDERTVFERLKDALRALLPLR